MFDITPDCSSYDQMSLRRYTNLGPQRDISQNWYILKSLHLMQQGQPHNYQLVYVPHQTSSSSINMQTTKYFLTCFTPSPFGHFLKSILWVNNFKQLLISHDIYPPWIQMLAASLVKQTNIKLSFGAFLWGLKESWPWDADWKYQKNVHINGHIADAHVQSFTGLRYIYICVCACKFKHYKESNAHPYGIFMTITIGRCVKILKIWCIVCIWCKYKNTYIYIHTNNIYIYMYMYMYVYLSVYVCMYVLRIMCIHIHLHIHLHINIHVHVYIYIHK